MAAPKELTRLVENFDRNLASYTSGAYNEAQVRAEFIDPMFELLGWDVQNKAGNAEAYKDVIHEDAIQIGGTTRAPDYCFRIGGARKFFLEAKKPSVSIKDEPTPAYQLRRYAWSAKLPLSILSDFAELAVYDCRVKPEKTDKPAIARINYLTYDAYPSKWDEIATVFSKDAVLKGSFDRFAEEKKGKKGTAAVDAEFLKEIERWRELLARNVALRNPRLSIRELNEAVQRTIDRIVFLRICEDRGIETDRQFQLQFLLNGANTYRRLFELFQRADERYNSGLFHFQREKGFVESPDTLTPGLVVDDKVLKDIVSNLYYPDSPYEFSVLPADILGQVYEQFLGKVIRLTAGHRAVVEDKPEVKKAGGVYYTPTYIVDYIVEHTVGELLKQKTPKQAADLKTLDPACGSGSFLLGAYQRLLDWHRDWYVNDGPDKYTRPRKGGQPALFQAGHGEWRLTTAERKRILLNSIFGVDIDPQAVEVTKLSLLLKVLEGESKESINAQLKLFHERALPDLGSNIKCGNSLIGSDFFQGRQGELFDDEEALRVNPFDWDKGFPEIFTRENPGFDAVIGNPPYVRQESLSELKAYFESHYESFDGVADLYAYFMEKGVGLLRGGGLFSIIVSSSFLRATYGEPLRRTLKRHAAVQRIVDFGGLAVFTNAKDTYVCIPLLAKGAKQKRVEVSKVASLKNLKLAEYVAANHFTIPHERLSPEAWSLKSDAEAAVFDKVMKAGKPLGDYVERRLFYGIKTGLNEAFIIDAETTRRLIAKDKHSAELIHPLLGGEDIRRYIFHETGLWLIFTRRGVDIKRYPAIREHLANWKEDLTPKRDKNAKRGRKPGRYEWYEIQDDVAYYGVFDGPKIVFPDICKGPRFSLDTGSHYLANTAYCLGTDDRYLLGVLNSRLFWFAISNISIPFGVRAGSYRYRLIYQYMEKVPIRVVDRSDRTNSQRHDRIAESADRMLALHSKLAAARTDHEKTVLQRQIDATDREIDQLVYELYGLTEEEIKIVEHANDPSG
jgi:hypothetical protein